MTLTTDRLREIASGDAFICTQDDESVAMARELLANREAQPVQVTDGMALDFHHALTDGSIGSDELEEIKVGLRAALCNVAAPPAPTNAQIAGYFVRQRPQWDERAPWTPWKEVDEASYADIVKIIATGEAYCGWFYDTRILYTAPPAPAVPEEMTGGIAMNKYKVKKSNYAQWVKGWNACRAAMLAQPVSQPYTLPEGGK